MKKRLLVVMIACLAVMCIALAGCSGGSGGSTSADSSSKDIDAMLAKYEVTDPESVTSKGVDLSADKPKSKEELATLYDEDIKQLGVGETTFEDVMNIMQTDPNHFAYWENSGNYSFRWKASESDYSYIAVSFKKTEDGSWDYRGSARQNL